MTNRKHKTFIDSRPDFSNNKYLEPFTLIEFQPFLSLLILIGAYGFIRSQLILYILKILIKMSTYLRLLCLAIDLIVFLVSTEHDATGSHNNILY